MRPTAFPRPLHQVLALAATLVLVVSGCNIFSWTHDEGSSDDPEVLLQDAEDALLDREYDKALQYAEKGIAQDPSIGVPRLRYVAAQAVLGRGGISIASFLNAFTNQSGQPKPGTRTAGGSYQLLNLSLAELQEIARSCPAAVRFLSEILQALEEGRVRPEDLSDILFDVNVGVGVGQLLTAFVTILDGDQDLSNGFTPTELVRLEADETGGYRIVYTGPEDPVTYVRCNLWCPLRVLFCSALEGIHDAYSTAKGLPPDDLCSGNGPVRPKPQLIDTEFVIGQVLDFTYDGVASLYGAYGGQTECDGCARISGGSR